MFSLTLNLPDGTQWIAGGFGSMDDLNAWLTNEQAKPYWQQGTTWTIVDNTKKES